MYYDQMIEKRNLFIGDLVLLFNSILCLFPINLNSNLNGTFRVTQVFQHGAAEFDNKERKWFKVNE